VWLRQHFWQKLGYVVVCWLFDHGRDTACCCRRRPGRHPGFGRPLRAPIRASVRRLAPVVPSLNHVHSASRLFPDAGPRCRMIPHRSPLSGACPRLPISPSNHGIPRIRRGTAPGPKAEKITGEDEAGVFFPRQTRKPWCRVIRCGDPVALWTCLLAGNISAPPGLQTASSAGRGNLELDRPVSVGGTPSSG